MTSPTTHPPLFIYFDEPDERGVQLKINAEVAFIFATRFGFPVEVFTEMVNNRFKSDPAFAAYHTAQAYAIAKGLPFPPK